MKKSLYQILIIMDSTKTNYKVLFTLKWICGGLRKLWMCRWVEIIVISLHLPSKILLHFPNQYKILIKSSEELAGSLSCPQELHKSPGQNNSSYISKVYASLHSMLHLIMSIPNKQFLKICLANTTYITNCAHMFNKSHHQTFPDILTTERSSKVGLHCKCNVWRYEGLQDKNTNCNCSEPAI